MLAAYLGLCAVFSIAAMNTQGDAGIALFIMIFVFESCCFATIFTLALRGIGRHTKRGGSFLVSAISGGGEFYPILFVTSYYATTFYLIHTHTQPNEIITKLTTPSRRTPNDGRGSDSPQRSLRHDHPVHGLCPRLRLPDIC